MKSIKIIFTVLFSILISTTSFSQLNYTNNNKLGIGRTPSHTLDVNGQTRLSGYVGINGPVPVGYPLGVRSYYGKDIQIDPSLSSSRIAASTDNIHFYYNSSIGYNKIYAQSFSIGSDSIIKKNIESLTNGTLQKVLNMRPVSFEYKEEQELLNDGKSKKIGLIAQELEKIIPEAVSYSEVGKIKMIDYDMLIPVLIKAIQEQQDDIKNLQAEVKKLKSGKSTKELDDKSNPPANNEDINKSNPNLESNNLIEDAILYQNSPNPFSEQTEIRYSIPNNAASAYLYIFDMQGKIINTESISNFGTGFIKINGYQYESGMYLYTLIVNGQEVDTKRMILTK